MSATHIPSETTRASVQSLSQFGVPRDQIAAHIGISEPTLRKHYAAELAAGKLSANVKVLTNLFAYASGVKGAAPQQVTAAIFWAKTQCGFKETIDVNAQHSYVDGARERLAGKLGAAIPPQREEGAPSIAPPIGSA